MTHLLGEADELRDELALQREGRCDGPHSEPPPADVTGVEAPSSTERPRTRAGSNISCELIPVIASTRSSTNCRQRGRVATPSFQVYFTDA